MRKFYVFYRSYTGCGEYEYDGNVIITLDKNEKANIDTFETKLNEMGKIRKRKDLISWSLIEE